MARLTPTPTGQKTKNKEGGTAYDLGLKDRFVSRVMTCLFMEPKFYGDTTNDLIVDTKAMLNKDPDFVLKTAIYARKVMNLRTVPILLIALHALNKDLEHKNIGKAVFEVCSRPDQLQDLVGYLNESNEKVAKRLHPLLKAIAARLNSFDEYQFGKYIASKRKVSLGSLIRLSHPKPKDEEQAKLFKSVMFNRVPAPNTWETKYMQAKSDEDKREVWRNLIATGKLPYMAALRNLRNMIQCGTDHNVLLRVGEMLADPQKVAKSKQLPFRFWSAYRELTSVHGASPILPFVSNALTASIANVPKLEGATFMSADNSGSMYNPCSSKSSTRMSDIANLFQAIMVKANPTNTSASVFGSMFQEVVVNPNSDVFDMAERFKNTHVGHSTNGYLILQCLADNKINVDRVIIFTDCQLYVSARVHSYCEGYESRDFITALSRYRKEVNPNVWIHWVDLTGYGTLPMCLHDRKVTMTAGWSDSVLRYFHEIEQGTGSMISSIETVLL